MTTLQKRIRDLANIFAIILIVGIFSGISGLLFLITGGVTIKDRVTEDRQNVEFMQEYQNIDEIEIEIASANLQVVTGNSFKVEASDSVLDIKQKNNELKIEEDGGMFSSINGINIILHVPEGTALEKFDLQSGAGAVSIESLSCKKLKLEVGAGEANAQYLSAVTSADIEVGAGEIYVADSDLNNLKFEVGVGEGYLKGDLTGRNEIEVGIGELVLDITSPMTEYTIEAETGIGNFNIGNEEISGNRTFGNGANILEVTGGIGSVSVDFEQQ